MVKLTAAVLALFTFLFSRVSFSFAQDVGQMEPCFLYYQYGKVKVNLALDKSQYISGETGRIIGTVVNTTTSALRDVIVYAHLVIENDDPESFARDGHYLVDRMTLLADLNFLPGETKQIDLPLPIPDSYRSGDYQLQYFIVTKEGFYYAGRPFLPEDMAGVSNFQITNDANAYFLIDPESLTVNGENHYFREQIVEFPNDQIVFTIGTKSSQVYTQIPVKVEYYKFDDSSGDNLVSSDAINLLDSDTKASAIFNPTSTGAYVVVFTIDKPQKTILRYRFAVGGDQAPDLKMADLSLTNYPPEGAGRAYVCFHSPSDKLTTDTVVSLMVVDEKNNVVEQKAVSGSFDGRVQAITVPLDKISGYSDFTLRAEFAREGEPPYTKVEKNYGCSSFSQSVSDVNVKFDDTSSNLAIEALNSCGATVPGEGRIDSIRVYKDLDLVKEAYNLSPVTSDFAIDDLPPGSYTAQVRVGDTDKELDFVIKESSGKTKRYLLVFLILIIALVLFMLYFKRNKKQKHHG